MWISGDLADFLSLKIASFNEEMQHLQFTFTVNMFSEVYAQAIVKCPPTKISVTDVLFGFG